MQPDNSVVFKGITVQLLPFCSKYWEHIAKWHYSTDYKGFFRQFTRILNEDELQHYDRVINGEVFIIHSLKDNQVVGMIQLIPCTKKNKAGFMGIIVDKEYQNKHIPHEATLLFLDYALNRQGYNKVIVEILESDEGLKKTLERTGWYKEGKMLQECFMDGKYMNELRYSMSAYYYNKNKDKFLKEYKLWVDSLNQ